MAKFTRGEAFRVVGGAKDETGVTSALPKQRTSNKLS